MGEGGWGEVAATGPNAPGARKFGAGFILGRRSNASCLMQWEQARPGLESPDPGSQGAPGGGCLAAEAERAAPTFLAETCMGEGQKEGWTPAPRDPERWLQRSRLVKAASGSRGEAKGMH